MSTKDFESEAREMGRNIILYVRHELEQRKIPRKEFGRQVGVTEGTLRVLLTRANDIQLSTVLKLAHGLGIAPATLIRAGMREQPPGRTLVKGLLAEGPEVVGD